MGRIAQLVETIVSPASIEEHLSAHAALEREMAGTPTVEDLASAVRVLTRAMPHSDALIALVVKAHERGVDVSALVSHLRARTEGKLADEVSVKVLDKVLADMKQETMLVAATDLGLPQGWTLEGVSRRRHWSRIGGRRYAANELPCAVCGALEIVVTFRRETSTGASPFGDGTVTVAKQCEVHCGACAAYSAYRFEGHG